MESWGEMEEEGSECSSGCQSGWTMYLDQSNENHHLLPFGKAGTHFQHDEDDGEDDNVVVDDDDDEEEEEEEDLSMVSDASSGPPHLHEEDYHHCCYSSMDKSGGKRRRVEGEKQQESQKHVEFSSFLDDTASSPLFSFPKSSFNASISSINPPAIDGVLEFSSCFSATHFKL
ncbi:hypothetical protein J5N97_015635 [Dioscorea zingiberensis]|uniref:Uncharacterized protein n=1 Tax=Dioscorea zingiberensis TaxID=325984 RepID=A0A9D5CII5_9LILI|nr:hypothetical protein J5N97_015635 [Dioscorea zingiberensis]